MLTQNFTWELVMFPRLCLSKRFSFSLLIDWLAQSYIKFKLYLSCDFIFYFIFSFCLQEAGKSLLQGKGRDGEAEVSSRLETTAAALTIWVQSFTIQKIVHHSLCREVRDQRLG